MRTIIIPLALFLTFPALAEDLEFEITFYFQPDDTGNNTLNKSIEIDGDELTIEESHNDRPNRYEEREATEDEIAYVRSLVEERITGFEFAEGEDVDAPKVEIEFEFESGNRSIEVEEVYAAGSVPDEYMALQKRFFEDQFE